MGDKVLPWVMIAPTGRLVVTSMSREGTATTENPKGDTTRGEQAGPSYRYRLRAVDCAGNVSGYGIGRQFVVAAAQAGAFGGAVRTARTAGNSAALAVSGAFDVGWVSTRDSASGGARMLFDGAAAGTVSLNAASTTPAVVVFRRAVTTAPHTLRVNVDGTAGRPKVTVDAFVALK